MKIKKLVLENYKQFKGKHVFEFADGLTIIKGDCGTGKTILFNAMRDSSTKTIPGVKLTVSGKASELAKHKDLVFIEEDKLNSITKENLPEMVKYIASLSAEDKAILDLWYLLAKRQILGLNLPLLIDSPFARLDKEDKERFACLLKDTGCQLIIFEHTSEFKNLKGDKEYMLDFGR